MTLRRPPIESVLKDIQRRLESGENVATAQRVRCIAEREQSGEVLRALVHLLCDALEAPKKRRVGRPAKAIPLMHPNGAYNLDAIPSRTEAQSLHAAKAQFRDFAMCEAISTAGGTVAAIELAAQKHHVSIGYAKAAYYAWRRRQSKKS